MAISPNLGQKDGLVDKLINTAYDTVKIVSDNIDKVITVESTISNGDSALAIAAPALTAADLAGTNADVITTNADIFLLQGINKLNDTITVVKEIKNAELTIQVILITN